MTNFRDAAAEGLELADGGWMVSGVVYRSAFLKEASKVDLARIRDAGVVRIIDLRTSSEVRKAPDRLPAKVDYRWVNLMNLKSVPPLGKDPAATRARTRDYYADFVADPVERSRTAEVLKLIISADGAVLFHCTAGKDRTGWIAALLQRSVGVDSDQVMTEYLKSNVYRADLIEERYQETLAKDGVAAARNRRVADKVRAEYLQSALDEVESRYGDFDSYLQDGLGLTPKQVKKLKAKLTA